MSASLLYGSGLDGVLDFNSTNPYAAGAIRVGNVYTMNRDIHASSIAIRSGIVVKPNGWMIYCTGAITFYGNGKINANGNPGLANGTGGLGLVAKSWGNWYTANSGGTGGSGNGGAVVVDNNLGGLGGSGGAGEVAQIGGTSTSSVSKPLISLRGITSPWYLFSGGSNGTYEAIYKWNPGAGGGGGAGDGAVAGGGGGAGAGAIFVSSRSFVAQGTFGKQFAAMGGAGGTPVTGKCGGGGGGGGGIVIIVTSVPLPAGIVLDVSGGAGGLKSTPIVKGKLRNSPGNQTDGVAGKLGNVIVLLNN